MSYTTKGFDSRIVELLKASGVGFMPSGTIYGLSCRALDQTAVERLHRLKKREADKPFIVLVADTVQLHELGLIATDGARALKYWPGKVSVILESISTPAWLHRGTGSLCVRQPAPTSLRRLLKQTGPLISTSANLSGQPPINSVKAAVKTFGDQLDFYVDAGRLRGKPSTIVKPIFGELEIVRQGAVRIRKGDRK